MRGSRDDGFKSQGWDFSRGVQIARVGLGAEAPLVGAAAIGFRSRGIDAR